MSKYELIAAVLAFAIFIFAMVFSGKSGGDCKIEGIKAGKSAEDIVKICRG